MAASELYFVEREYAVSIEVLWSAWTDAAKLEQWYSPTELSVLPGSAVSENFVGGRWAIAVDVTAHGFNAYFWGRLARLCQTKNLFTRFATAKMKRSLLLATTMRLLTQSLLSLKIEMKNPGASSLSLARCQPSRLKCPVRE